MVSESAISVPWLPQLRSSTHTSNESEGALTWEICLRHQLAEPALSRAYLHLLHSSWEWSNNSENVVYFSLEDLRFVRDFARKKWPLAGQLITRCWRIIRQP